MQGMGKVVTKVKAGSITYRIYAHRRITREEALMALAMHRRQLGARAARPKPGSVISIYTLFGLGE